MATVLKDPTIDCGVFEIAVETVLDRGLGYDFADIGIVLNVRDEGKIYDEARIMEDIPLLKKNYNGAVIETVLASAAAFFFSGISEDTIRRALSSYEVSSFLQLPCRSAYPLNNKNCWGRAFYCNFLQRSI